MGTSRLPTKCALCGTDPAGGQATTYDGKTLVRLCHDDGPVDTGDERTCYQKWRPSSEAADSSDRSHR